MKINFSDGHKTITADEIMRFKVEGGGVFHVLVDDEGVDIYSPNKRITCYQVDGKEITDGCQED